MFSITHWGQAGIIVANQLDDLMAQNDVLLHHGAAQIEVTIFQPQRFIDIGIPEDFERAQQMFAVKGQA